MFVDSLIKRYSFAGNIGQSAGCPLQQTIVGGFHGYGWSDIDQCHHQVYTGVAADCKYVQQYGSIQNATSAILNDWNMASGLYKVTTHYILRITINASKVNIQCKPRYCAA